MAQTRWHDGIQRNLRAGLVAVVSILIGAMLATQSPAQAYEGPPVPDPQDLIDLVRDTVLAVDSGNKSGDYQTLYAMGSARFQSEHPTKKLAEEFASLKSAAVDLGPVRSLTPVTSRPPTLDRNGLLRMLGFFEIENRRIVFDLVYDYDTALNGWRLAGISIDPRVMPPEPKLMQPE